LQTGARLTAERERLKRALLCALTLPALAATACERAHPPDTSPGVSRDLARWRAEAVHDLRYDVALTIPSTRDSAITGRVAVRFRLDGASVVPPLDFVDAQTRVQSATWNGEEVPWEGVNDHLAVHPENVVPGDAELVIEFIAGDQSLNRQSDFLYTLFVPDRARTVLPVFDQPDLKAAWTLTLNVPLDWTAVANGAVEVEDVASGVRRYRFAETKPLSTYLFAFAAGRFMVEEAERHGRTMRMFHRETDTTKLARNLGGIFDLHASALAWLEAYTGIPYPFDKFDFVLVPSFQYGGMEHPGAILYRAERLLLDETATQNDSLGQASLIAHETAHMWFGDLVTMAWFDDVWTKEVFANFMAAKIVNPSFPEVDHELRFLLAHYPAAYAVDRTAGTHPIRQPLDNLREAGTLYGAIIYQKAPVVMRHLERRVGAEAFRAGLREYLRAFAFRNATWPNLIAILDARTEEDLAAWSRVWVEEGGRPEVRTAVHAGSDGRVASLQLEQEDPAGRRRVWPQELGVLLGSRDGNETVTADLSAPSVAVEQAQGRAAPEFVLPNGDGLGYGRFVLDSASRAFLLEHLLDVEPPLVRGAAWLTLWDAMLYGEVAPVALLDLMLRALPAEPVELNTQRILGYLRETWWRYLTPEQRKEEHGRVEETLWTSVGAAGSTSLKSAYFSAYRDIATSPQALERLERVWRRTERIHDLPLSEQDRSNLAQALAVREVPNASEILVAQHEAITNPDRKARFAFVMPALSADSAVRDSFFHSLREPANREREPWVLEGLSYLHHPLRAEQSRQYILPALEMLEEIQRTGDIFFPLGWLEATLGGHNTPEAAELVRGFLEGRQEYPTRLRNKVLQAADGVWRGAEVASP
jgi:aminopeptidase N